MNAEYIRQIMEMIMRSGLRPNMSPSEWLAVLIYLDKKGWLKIFDKDGHVMVATAAYRVKEFNLDTKDKLPEFEEGNKLFIPFFLSRSNDRMEAQRITKEYLDKHPDINEIIFEDKNNRLRRFNRREGHGRKKENRIAGNTAVL